MSSSSNALWASMTRIAGKQRMYETLIDYLVEDRVGWGRADGVYGDELGFCLGFHHDKF